MTNAGTMYVPPSDLDPVERAMRYPYAIPDCSFIFDKAGWRPAEIGGALTAGRHPVIACGSNRSPDQLARKYFDFDAVTIPVQRGWLRDFDVVYAAHITGYGSISACPMPAPGVCVEVSVAWLSDGLMDRMHATEGRGHAYDYAELSGLDLALEGGGGLDEAFAYIHRGGALNIDGSLVGLSEIAVQDRPWPSWPQPWAIAEVHRRLNQGGTVEDFIRENAADRFLRLAREAVLQQDAHPFAHRGCRVIPAGTE